MSETMPKQGKKTVWILLAVLAVVAVAVYFFALRPQAAQAPSEQAPVSNEPAAIAVSTYAPERGELVLTAEYIGTTQPLETVDAYAKASGRITSVWVTAGQPVKKGDVLFTVDASDAELGFERAKLAYERAQETYKTTTDGSSVESQLLRLETAVTVALRNYDTIKSALDIDHGFDTASYAKLRRAYKAAEEQYQQTKTQADLNKLADAEGALTDLTNEISAYAAKLTNLNNAFDNLEDARKQYDLYKNKTRQEIAVTAASALRDAELAYQQAEQTIANYTATAPIDGVVEFRAVDTYNMYTAMTPAVTISNKDVISVSFNVSADGAAALRRDDVVQVTKGKLSYPATIVEVSTKMQAASGLFPVKATINGESAFDYSGVKVKVSAATARSENALLVPNNCVYYEDGAPYVYLLKDGVAKKTFFNAGIMNPTTIEVMSGITENDRVITTWHPDLKDGAAVRLKSELTVAVEPADAAKGV